MHQIHFLYTVGFSRAINKKLTTKMEIESSIDSLVQQAWLQNDIQAVLRAHGSDLKTKLI